MNQYKEVKLDKLERFLKWLESLSDPTEETLKLIERVKQQIEFLKTG